MLYIIMPQIKFLVQWYITLLPFLHSFRLSSTFMHTTSALFFFTYPSYHPSTSTSTLPSPSAFPCPIFLPLTLLPKYVSVCLCGYEAPFGNSHRVNSKSKSSRGLFYVTMGVLEKIFCAFDVCLYVAGKVLSIH
jgi:hypothetical protein